MIIGMVALAVWAWWWGWWSHDATRAEIALAALWPVLFPIGKAFHRYRWGSAKSRRHVYSNTRWWQRGDRSRRPSNWAS